MNDMAFRESLLEQGEELAPISRYELPPTQVAGLRAVAYERLKEMGCEVAKRKTMHPSKNYVRTIVTDPTGTRLYPHESHRREGGKELFTFRYDRIDWSRPKAESYPSVSVTVSEDGNITNVTNELGI